MDREGRRGRMQEPRVLAIPSSSESDLTDLVPRYCPPYSDPVSIPNLSTIRLGPTVNFDTELVYDSSRSYHKRRRRGKPREWRDVDRGSPVTRVGQWDRVLEDFPGTSRGRYWVDNLFPSWYLRTRDEWK